MHSKLSKACIACTRSKRRCDRAQPECARCIERDVDCRYPPQKHRRNREGERAVGDGRETGSAETASGVLSNDGGGFDWDATALGITVTTPPSLSLLPSISPLPSPLPLLQGTTPCSSTTMIPHTARDPSWFLRPESWVVRHSDDNTTTFHTSVLHAFTVRIWAQLREFVATGTTEFIHPRLYRDHGLPLCLQDAFAALAAYFARTPDTELLTLHIIETKAAALLGQEEEEVVVVRDFRAELARVQALAMYTFVRLYDGSVRQRSLAEGVIPTLHQWCRRALAAGSSQIPAIHAPSSSPSSVWHSWLQSESLRRTWLVVPSICGVYLTMRDGWSSCPGGLGFTARRGLWEARSVQRWCEVLAQGGGDPLFVEWRMPLHLVLGKSVGEIDPFVVGLLTLAGGDERIRDWEEGGGGGE